MDKAILLLLLMANLINSANLVAKEVRENEIQTNSYMENPDFNYSVKQKIVNLKGDYSFLSNNSSLPDPTITKPISSALLFACLASLMISNCPL